MKDMETSENNKVALKESIFERISEEKVCPRSRWVFRGREALVWGLWLSSVFVGALAIAVTLFVISHQQYAFYEATHENFYTFIIEALPYIWLIVFGTMTFAAVYNLRHTKRGYRYPVWQILTSSLVLSFAGGSALHMVGFGYAIDHELGERMTAYSSQEKIESRIWQNPEAGRLVGRIVETSIDPVRSVFEDSKGQQWLVDVDELPSRDLQLLQSEKTVRALGKVITDNEQKLFHLCGVFPWAVGPETSLKELGKERQMFIENAKEHIRRIEERLEIMRDEDDEEKNDENPASVCVNLDVVRKVGGGNKIKKQ